MAGLRTATAASTFVYVGVCVFAFASVNQMCLKTHLCGTVQIQRLRAPQTRTRKRACPYIITRTHTRARVHTHRHTPTHMRAIYVGDVSRIQFPPTHARTHAHTHYRSPVQFLIALIVATVVVCKTSAAARNASKGSVSPVTHLHNPRDRMVR